MTHDETIDPRDPATILTELASSVSAHMLREEKNLFPRIEELDLHPHKVRAGSISRPLLNEFIEHDVVHERIATIRELSNQDSSVSCRSPVRANMSPRTLAACSRRTRPSGNTSWTKRKPADR